MINRNIINGVSIDGVSNAAGAVKHREILLNQTEIRLYFPIDLENQMDSDRFQFQINQKMVNTI